MVPHHSTIKLSKETDHANYSFWQGQRCWQNEQQLQREQAQEAPQSAVQSSLCFISCRCWSSISGSMSASRMRTRMQPQLEESLPISSNIGWSGIGIIFLLRGVANKYALPCRPSRAHLPTSCQYARIDLLMPQLMTTETSGTFRPIPNATVVTIHRTTLSSLMNSFR